MQFIKIGLAAFLGLVVIALGLIYFIPGYDAYVVRSDSMKPTFSTGALIVSVPSNSLLGGPVEPGSVIIFKQGTELITHRVVSNDFFSVTTKGDANNAPDPHSVAMSDIKGTYLFHIPGAGYAVNFLQTRTGWFLCVLLPTFLLVVWIVIEILKEAFKKEESTGIIPGKAAPGNNLREGAS